jgi:hypothetical protein
MSQICEPQSLDAWRIEGLPRHNTFPVKPLTQRNDAIGVHVIVLVILRAGLGFDMLGNVLAPEKAEPLQALFDASGQGLGGASASAEAVNDGAARSPWEQERPKNVCVGEKFGCLEQGAVEPHDDELV